jgi:hypothetical protein
VSDGAAAAARSELDAVAGALEQLVTVVAEGERAYRLSTDRRGRVRYLWIIVGSRLKNYYQVIGPIDAVGEFAHAIGLRHVLAYRRPDEIDDDIVWSTSVEDLPRLKHAVDEAVTALAT